MNLFFTKRFLSRNFKIHVSIENQLKNSLILGIHKHLDDLEDKPSKEKALAVVDKNNWKTIKDFTEDQWNKQTEHRWNGILIYNEIKKLKG